MTATSQPILAYRARDAVEARALAAHLEAAGVEVHVLGEFLQGAYAGLHIGGMDAPEVWVPADDLSRAQSVIAEWREGHADGLSSAASENAKPFKLQFSTAALLWLMTVVAIFAAGVAFELITYANWPAWILDLLILSLVLLVALKTVRRLLHRMRYGRDDDDAHE